MSSRILGIRNQMSNFSSSLQRTGHLPFSSLSSGTSFAQRRIFVRSFHGMDPKTNSFRTRFFPLADVKTNKFKILGLLTVGIIAMGGTKLYAENQKKTLVLGVRHGETHRNKVGERISGQENGAAAQLNETGREQADNVGRELAKRYPVEKIAAIYTSTLQRCQDTASIIGSHFPEVPVYSDPRLMEFNHGKYDTYPFKLRNQTCAEKYQQIEQDAGKEGVVLDPYFKWKLRFTDLIELKPGMTETPKEGEPENALEVLGRVQEVIKDIQKKHPGKIVIVVSHAGVIKTLGIESIWREKAFSTPRPMYFEATPSFNLLPSNCSVTHFEVGSDG